MQNVSSIIRAATTRSWVPDVSPSFMFRWPRRSSGIARISASAASAASRSDLARSHASSKTRASCAVIAAFLSLAAFTAVTPPASAAPSTNPSANFVMDVILPPDAARLNTAHAHSVTPQLGLEVARG